MTDPRIEAAAKALFINYGYDEEAWTDGSESERRLAPFYNEATVAIAAADATGRTVTTKNYINPELAARVSAEIDALAERLGAHAKEEAERARKGGA